MASSLPQTCKAVVVEAPNAPFTIKEVPVEPPKEGEILIKVLACGVCHSDNMVQRGLFGSPMYASSPCYLQELTDSLLTAGP